MHGIALKYIDAVNRYGSIREAARRLNVSSSSITRQIQKVEYHYGIRLFERGTDGVRTTENGQLLLRHIHVTLRDWERTQIQLDNISGKRVDSISIAATDSIASSFLPILLSDCLEENTAVRFNTAVRQSPDICNAVAKGGIDIGFTFLPHNEPGIVDHAECHLRIGVLASPHHPLAIRDSVELADVLEYPLVVSSVRAPIFQQISAQLESAYKNYEPWIQTESLTMIHALVDSGRFIALGTALSTVKHRDNTSGLSWIPIVGSTLPNDRLVLVTRDDVHSTALKWFVNRSKEFLKSSFGESYQDHSELNGG